MRILFANLGYGRGHDGSLRSYTLQAHRFVRMSSWPQRVVLDQFLALIECEQPDVVAYAEIATGSRRNVGFDQHQYLVEQLGERSVAAAAVSKYGETILNRAPFHVGNCNGVISFLPARIEEHFLASSRKKLVFRVELEGLTVFVVHLPLLRTDRGRQLQELAELVNGTSGDVIVCGDFNIFDGLDELKILQTQTQLRVAGTGEPTYPSATPRLQLDVFLYRIEGLKRAPDLRVLSFTASDHCPVVFTY